jgi:hypothetical protein
VSESFQSRLLKRHWPLVIPALVWLLLFTGFLQSEVLRTAAAVACIALMLYQWLAYRKTSTRAQFVFLSFVVAAFGLSSVWLALNVVRFYTYGHESDGMGLWHVYVIHTQDILLRFIGALVVVVSVWAVSGWWIQRHVARRRLRKLGFSADDIRSEDAIFKKWGEIAAAKIIPQKISFNEITSHSWSQPSKYEQSKTAFEALGFRRKGTFVASPQKWIVEFWLSDEPGLFATIVDARSRGVYSELTVLKNDGSTVGFDNLADCGLQHYKPDSCFHCGLIAPDQLVERAFQARPPNDFKQTNLAECVRVYEQSVNEYLAWRRSVGISGSEMKLTFERLKRTGSLKKC